TLSNVKRLQGPQFLHVVTKKGKGYPLAEDDPILYHGVGKFDSKCGISGGASKKPTYTEIFGKWLCDTAEKDERLIGITPAMREGSGMVEFSERFPARYYDVGIAEQHALTFAAGLACEGMKPVVAIYSTFLQRAYDQLIHDIAIQNLPVVFAIDRAGLVGADGPTHAGSFDLSYLRCIPNMTVMAASNENELRQMLHTAFMMDSPVAVRYPRGSGVGAEVETEMKAIEIGRGTVLRSGQRVALLAFGSMVEPALHAAVEFEGTVANMRFVKPLDEKLVLELARTHELLVTVEENAVMGGAGSAVAECLASHGVSVPLLHLGLPDRYIEQGDPAGLLSDCLLDAEGIANEIQQLRGE
ncbi:MAG TPA: 1-deoxy-D-xylulose-5-phosphate synthase, partial [Burkholderiales bacterium]|nr:1-deoxy-D-xylulose-5-phosphate synthase [Burkholderiales bacterium]